MQSRTPPVSRWKIVLTWAILIFTILFWIVFWLWWHNRGGAAKESVTSGIGHFIFMTFIGLFFLVAGLASYAVTVITNCFTFDFTYPVWKQLKTRIYFANILVPVMVMLGIGFMLSAVVTPMLSAVNIPGSMAGLLPVFAVIAVGQIILIWVQVWTPVERRVILKRLAARGIAAEYLNSGMLVGLSDPTRSSFKKWASVEEDIGMLWISPQQLVYWGDTEQFGVTRDQLLRIERKADAGSITILSGVTHVVLHVRTDDGGERHIRLHTQGVWTMGRKRSAMDELAQSLANWQAAAAPALAETREPIVTTHPSTPPQDPVIREAATADSLPPVIPPRA